MTNLEDLEKLHDLKEKGIISDADFEERKAQILQEVGECKSQLAYCLLAFFLGILGIHNFYAGRWKRGLAQLLITLLTFFIGAIFTNLWAVINIFTIHTDGKGNEFEPCKPAKYILGILGLSGYILFVGAFLLVMVAGGVAGYSKAMSRYQANELMNYSSMVAMISLTKNGGQGIEAPVACDSLMPSSPEFFTGDCVAYPGGKVVLSGVDAEVRKVLTDTRQMQADVSGNLIFSR